ncbi:carboxyl-terminal processing protease CtpA [Rivularia sp. UHCC 0363]|uniref:carboxyl-terminal processing protease CtpA n=1 Tax=Rivularia sp. UHCC 0363 TaxID=3110244 RepID=UPI002B210A6F|nr:carboxyl-terminal processing protease CtpA [Rivularia sp. UHCC 0363]MEA5594548.1 S41 family peptidase [Rivularia sp. UHCC 0363]
MDNLKVFRGILSFTMAFLLAFGSFCFPALALTDEQKLVSQAWRIVNHTYLDDTFNHQNWAQVRQKALKAPLEDSSSAYEAIQNMLKTLDDPFTRFLDPQQYRSLQVNTSGELTGVGLQIALDSTGKLEVVAPIAGSPAEKAGIQSRDRITKIEDTPTENLTLDEAASLMRGKIGSTVSLVIERDGASTQSVIIVRDRITLNPVIAKLQKEQENNIGYIRLTQFNANAPTELAHAIDELEKKGADSYILDLRNNPGGLLQAGIEIARLWLDPNIVVYTVNRQGIQGSFESFSPALTHDPLVILVNQGTASASEILAGALQDNHRATLVGEKTFGKGLIQSLFELSDGSGLAVTIAKYETPSHRDINKLGITPDKVIPFEPIKLQEIATSSDTQYQAAVELLQETANSEQLAVSSQQ